MPSSHTHGVELAEAYIGDDRVLRAYLGDELVYDDTGATIVELRPAHATSSTTDITVGRGARPALASAGAAMTAPDLEVWVGARLALPTAVSQSSAPAPGVGAGAMLALPPALAASVACDVSVGKTVVELPPAASVASVPAATVSAGARVDLGAAARSSATAPAPAVSAGARVALTPAASKASAPSGEVRSWYVDDFNRANSTSLGPNWTETGNDSGIISNALGVQGTTAGRRGAIWNAQTQTWHQFVEFTMATAPNATAASGAILRCNAAMTEMVILSCASTQWALGSITGINGTFTLIKSQNVTIGAGAVVRVEVDQTNTYRVYVNGVLSGMPVVSSTYADANHRYLGLFTQRSGTTNSAFVDNFKGGDTPPLQLVASDDFNRASLGPSWTTYGGGTLYISNGEISGVGTPSEPISYAIWNTPGPSNNQVVRAKIRWNGRVPEHSAVSVCLRANLTTGHNGVHFWCVSNLMGICWYDASHPNGFLAATGTENYVSTSQFPEGAVMELRADGEVYTASVNGAPVLQGTFTNAQVPLTNRHYGIQIQDDSAVSGGGQPPACLDDWQAFAA